MHTQCIFHIPTLPISTDQKDIHFVGQVGSGRLNISHLIDFGILTLCDHVISSHGTFGFWATILTSKDDSIHVLPKSVTAIHDKNGGRIMLKETLSIISSDFNNRFIFLDDD